VLYFAGTILDWTYKTQFILLHTMMISAIALAIFAVMNIIISAALQKRNPKRHFRASIAAYIFICISGIFWTVISGIILTIAKGNV
jgi:uncharacterized membrane protein